MLVINEYRRYKNKFVLIIDLYVQTKIFEIIQKNQFLWILYLNYNNYILYL